MGLLEFDGKPLDWEEIQPHIDYVKQHGLIQFVNNYRKLKKRPRDVLKWGDEVEYMIIYFDHANKKVHLSLRGNEICDRLQEKERNNIPNLMSLWRPEYSSYVVEGTPGAPYLGYMAQFNVVEANMKIRRQEIEQYLNPGEHVMSLTNFPTIGCPGFTYPVCPSGDPNHNPVSRSLFYPDQAISSHPRFSCLTRNIRQRRGQKVCINVPIFKDTNTPSPFVEELPDKEAQQAAKPDHIYMDCMGFGMGCCCLQLTFQACDITEAKFLYDQLAPICPIMLALSAAAPVYRGYLADIDSRWKVISASVDDRTAEERGLRPLQTNKQMIRKSRYDTIDSYLSHSSSPFNDAGIEVDQDAYQFLIDNGVDEHLSQHIAHLWVRDPLTLFSKKIELDDESDYSHFENLQSTNWQSMRFKPPPPGSSIGWRVEFRVLDAQLTDFENAAFVVFIVLLTRVILTYKIDFLMPISSVDVNMERAQRNDAARREKFFFRQNITTSASPQCCAELYDHILPQQPNDAQVNGDSNSTEAASTPGKKHEGGCCPPMTLDAIINGQAGVFPGLIPLVRRYLDSVEVGVQARCSIQEYLNLISKRASGEYLTTAQWIREFVRSHPDYKFDSVVNDTIAYDLLVQCNKLTGSHRDDQPEPNDGPQLFGHTRHKSEYVAGKKIDDVTS